MANNSKSITCEMVPVASSTVTWKLKDFSEWSEQLVQSARCDVELGGVEGDDSSKTTFRFKLKEWADSTKVYNHGRSANEADIFFALNLEMLNDLDQSPVSFKVRAQYDVNRFDTGESRFTLSDKKEVCVDKKFIYARRQQHGTNGTTVNIFRRFNGETASRNGTPELKIQITVTMFTLKQEEDGKSSEGIKPALALQRQRQSDEFALFLEDNHFWDVKLKMGDKVSLPAHRIILASGSSVFKAMLTSDMKESREQIIQIPDIGSEAMKIVLRHIYTGEVDINLEGDIDDELMKQVVYGASKYNLPQLFQHFDSVIIKVVHFGNAWELLKLAKMHNMPRATEDLEKFVKKNCLEIMQQTMGAGAAI